MEIDSWIGGCKVRIFPWIDGETIYCNVQYYRPGQSLSQPPVWDKTVYVKDNDAGRRVVYGFTDSLARYISTICYGELGIKEGNKILIDFDVQENKGAICLGRG